MSDSQLIGKRLRGYTITEQLGTPKEDWVVLRGTSPQGNIVFKLLWNHIQAQTFQRFQREISTHEELSEFNSNASRGGIAVFEDRIQPDELVGPFAGFQDGFAIRFYPRSLRDVIAGDLTFSERLKIAMRCTPYTRHIFLIFLQFLVCIPPLLPKQKQPFYKRFDIMA